MIGLGKLHNGLYLLQTSMDQSSSTNLFPQISLSKSSTHSSNNTSLPASVQCTNEQPTSMELWHYRLRHSSFDRLQFLHQYVQNLPFINKTTPFCDVCFLTKQKRLSFPNAGHICKTNFELIHCDI